MTKLRERFEAWYKEEFGVVPDYCFPINHKTGEYGSFDLQCRWRQWQAALEPVRELVAKFDRTLGTFKANNPMGDMALLTIQACRDELAKLLEE